MRIFLYILFIFPTLVFAQGQVTVSGIISDQNSGERLIGASIYSPVSKLGVSANSYGFFSIKLPKGSNAIQASYVGYQTSSVTINLRKDTVLNFTLKSSLILKEFTVKGTQNRNAHPYFSTLTMMKLDMAKMGDIPAILGERDLLKSIQFLPGIKGGAENTAGFNVRGGSSDQNLILLDGVPVYNVYHLMGFFSVFNGEAIKNAELFKGGIPARYGGHLSSVLDVSMKEGNLKKPEGTFTISPVAGSFTLEGPIKKDTASYIISVRRTFIDFPLMLIQKMQKQPYIGGYYFYDLNAKANWMLNQKNRIYLSFYSGLDRNFFTGNDRNLKQSFRYQWGNTTTVLRWNSTITPKLFSNTSLYFSSFNNTQRTKAKEGDAVNLFKTTSKLNEWSFKSDFDFYVSPEHVVRFGGKVSLMAFSPDILQQRNDETETNFTQETRKEAFAGEVYLEDAMEWGRMNANVGLRTAYYGIEGKTYLSFEPRIALNWTLKPDLTISASYMRNSQNLHLLTNSSLGLPTDLWVASTKNIAPQKADQYSLGIEKHIARKYTFGLEGYYKTLKNVTRFNEGAAFLSGRDRNWENNVSVGEGEAYGSEFMFRKENARLNWMLAYTLSWSNQRFDDINRGRWFPFKYDRRHDFSALVDYKLKSKKSGERKISLAFVFKSGSQVTINDTETEGVMLPGFEYYASPEYVDKFRVRQTYENPNNFKMPSFHHLDLNYSVKKYRNSGRGHEWSFSGYNIYNHLNPWMTYKEDGVAKQLSIFPFIPSVSYRYKW
ncbi:MAG: TonB-dependent receptor [Bacteroidota bacterium]|nr:TonB-dependent receptor [Bacteroidota bacterium]